MSEQYKLSVRSKQRAIWWRVSLGVLALAVTVRLGIALAGASQQGGAVAGFDLFLLSLVIVAGLMAVLLPHLVHRHRRQLRAVRQLFPDTAVEQTNVVPSTLELLEAAAPAPRLKVNVAAVVVFEARRLSIWRGVRKPRQVAVVHSEEPITYRVGSIEHYGREHPAILATVNVGGKYHTIPFAVLSANARGFKMAVGDELEEIVARMVARQQAAES